MDIQERFKIINSNIQDLQNHFKPLQNLSERSLRVWTKYLFENLSAEELDRAVDLAIISYGCNYDLSAKSLVELVKGSEKELSHECWARVLEVLSRKTGIATLDEASQWAVQKLGGINLLGELPITKLYDLKFEFVSHWNKYRRDPQEGFKPLSDTTPPEYREYEPDEIEAELTPEQKAKNEWLKKQLEGLANANKSKRKSINSTTNGHHN